MLDDKMLYAELGRRIQRYRRMQSPLMNQESLAKRVGLTRTSVTNIERGRQKVTLDTVYRLCEVFGISIAELMPALNEVTAESISVEAGQSVTVAGQTYALPDKVAQSVRRLLPDNK